MVHNIQDYRNMYVILAKEIRWCGRMISDVGTTLDAGRMSGSEEIFIGYSFVVNCFA